MRERPMSPNRMMSANDGLAVPHVPPILEPTQSTFRLETSWEKATCPYEDDPGPEHAGHAGINR